MAKKSATKNYIYNMFYQAVAMILPFVTTPYLARTLGSEQLGIYSYTVSIATYFAVFGTLGIATYGQREVAFVQDNVKKRSKAFYEIFILKTITITLSMILFGVTFCINRGYSRYYQILLLEILANAIDIAWFFQGLEEFKKVLIRNLVIRVPATIAVFLLIKSENDLSIYLLIYSLSNLLGNLPLWLQLPKYIQKVDYKKLNIEQHLLPTVQLFIPQLATQLYTVLDRSFIGYLIDDKSQVEFYNQALKIIRLILTLSTALGTVMAPRMAKTYASGDKKRLREYMKTSLSFILMLSLPLMFGLLSIIDRFVPKFYGPGFDKVALLIKIASPIIIFVSISSVLGNQYLVPTKQHKAYTFSAIMGALTNIVLNFVLIPKYASVGAAIAILVTEFTVMAIQLIIVKEFNTLDVIKAGYKYFIAGLIMYFASCYVGTLIHNAYAAMAYQVVISIFVYFVILIILKDKFLDELKERIEWLLNNIISNTQKNRGD